jgi:hypothetical protein
MNVKSRKIIGLSMSDKPSQELTSAALRDAVGRQSPSALLIEAGSMQAMHIRSF